MKPTDTRTLHQTSDLTEVNQMVRQGYDLVKVEMDSAPSVHYTLARQSKRHIPGKE